MSLWNRDWGRRRAFYRLFSPFRFHPFMQMRKARPHFLNFHNPSAR
jgi:hypothetical protein